MITFYPSLARLYSGHNRNRKKADHSDAPKASLLKVSYSNYAVLLLASFRNVSLNVNFIFKDTPVFFKITSLRLAVAHGCLQFLPSPLFLESNAWKLIAFSGWMKMIASSGSDSCRMAFVISPCLANLQSTSSMNLSHGRFVDKS